MTIVKSKAARTALLVIGLAGLFVPAGADTLKIKAHIPWGSIYDFEFFHGGVFVAPYGGGIGYFSIDDSFNLTHRYTINPGGDHMLSQFCVHDTFLFATDGSNIHRHGTPVFFVYSISDSSHTMLAGLEPSGTIWAYIDPIIYHEGNVIYHDYPGTYYRIDVTDPSNPSVTGRLTNTLDVCLHMFPYQDTLLIGLRQMGTAQWSGNFRIIRNNDPDSLISVGAYAKHRYSYTGGAAVIGQILFTAHLDGFIVYDISDLSNVREIYFYSTEWGRCVEQANNYLFMGCNDGLHLFHYQERDGVEHLLFWPHDRRVMRMRPKWEKNELWCFYDGGPLGGLVVLDVSDYLGIEEPANPVRVEPARTRPTFVRSALRLSGNTPAVLLDITGRKVADLKPGANDVRHVAPGIYFVRRSADSGERSAVLPEDRQSSIQRVIIAR